MEKNLYTPDLKYWNILDLTHIIQMRALSNPSFTK